MSFEQIFDALTDREELQYSIASDERPYVAKATCRFDTPATTIVFGDTLRRLETFRGTRAALKRHGFRANVHLVVNSTSEKVLQALEAGVAQPGAAQEAGAGMLQQEALKPLQTAINQMHISVKNVPLTDGYRRNLRHEGHNLNVTFGALTVFATWNFADNYAPLMFQLVRHEDSAEQPVEHSAEQPEGVAEGTIEFSIADDAPAMPTLKKMHQLVGQSPRAQAKFFLLMDDIADRFFIGIDASYVGRHRVHSSVPQTLCEDPYASTLEPSLGGFGIAELEPFESQKRGFAHGHRKRYSIPTMQHEEVLDLFANKESGRAREFLSCLKDALLACAASLQYDDSVLPAEQMHQTVFPEKFTAQQQHQSRLDGGPEEDGVTKRPFLEVTADERQGHEVLEQRRAAAERRPPANIYSGVSLKGCHQSLMPTYRLPQRIGTIEPLDELGMVTPGASDRAEQPAVVWLEDEQRNHVSSVCLVAGAVPRQLSAKELTDDATRWASSFCRDFRALSQLNHNHDCTSTCIKYVKKKAKDVAEQALRLGKVVACRFWFFHIVELTCLSAVMGCSSAEQPAENATETTTRRIRRRGKQLVPESRIASTNEHNEFCRALVRRSTPFRSSTTDAGQVWGRCNVDYQLMLRTLDPDVLLPDDSAEQPVPQVKPELALALHGVRAQLPDEPLLRRCFHSLVAMYQAAHNCDDYITKYQGKDMEQLQNLFAQIACGLRKLQIEQDSAEQPVDNESLAKKTILRIAMAANRSTWCSCCELALYIITGALCRKTHKPVQVFLNRPSFQLHECSRLLHRGHLQVIEAPDCNADEMLPLQMLSFAGPSRKAGQPAQRSAAQPAEPAPEEEAVDDERQSGEEDDEVADAMQADCGEDAMHADVRAEEIEDENPIQAFAQTTSVHDDWLHRGPYLYDMDIHTYIRFIQREERPRKAAKDKGDVIGRSTHVFLFDEHYELAPTHWQTLGHAGCKRTLPVLEALKCAPPTKGNSEENAMYKSLLGTLFKCPGPGCCADPLLYRPAFFKTGPRTYSVSKQWLARRSEIKYLRREAARKTTEAQRIPVLLDTTLLRGWRDRSAEQPADQATEQRARRAEPSAEEPNAKPFALTSSFLICWTQLCKSKTGTSADPRWGRIVLACLGCDMNHPHQLHLAEFCAWHLDPVLHNLDMLAIARTTPILKKRRQSHRRRRNRS